MPNEFLDEPEIKSKKLITESRLKTMRRCAREHHYRYDEGVVGIDQKEALRFGTLIHAALEAWWMCPADHHEITDTFDPELCDHALNALHLAASAETDDFEMIRAEEMIRGYHFRWVAERPHYVVLGVEEEFRGALKNPDTNGSSKTWIRAGKLDVRVRDGGRHKVVEHKTTSEDLGVDSDYWPRLRMDGQVSGYFRGAEMLGGENVEGCIYDVLKKTKLRPLKATPEVDRKYTKPTKTEPSRLYATQREFDETPGEYRNRVREQIIAAPNDFYQRMEVPRLADELAEHDADTWQQTQIANDNARRGFAPRNTDACKRFGEMCSYFGVCSGAADINDPAKFTRLSWKHPELKEDPK